ncbi:Unconventional myosin-XVIIIa [Portunus trituberculatus]|uniref:Unconventional myosin-XVIIIa n=1 Tax=Portunus trituberculatus TaxID=210409 RepID=A0A5B7DWJ0_PORTR|nr:Unconventional myosin-XVIIIa [Portunus trituberculatus]
MRPCTEGVNLAEFRSREDGNTEAGREFQSLPCMSLLQLFPSLASSVTLILRSCSTVHPFNSPSSHDFLPSAGRNAKTHRATSDRWTNTLLFRQEEELDDLAGQVQMLEGAKVRLEMSIEQMRKENRREVSQREEELEEVRLSAQKKVKEGKTGQGQQIR